MIRFAHMNHRLVAAFIAVYVSTPSFAAVVSFAGKINDLGPGGPKLYATDGYDFYATTTQGEPTSSGGVPFGPTRITNLPTYVSSVTSAGANSYYRSNLYAPIVDPRTGALVHCGLTYNFSNSNLEKGLLNLNVGPGAPPVFYVGYLTDVNDALYDYPDFLRMKQTAGSGMGDSGLIATVQDVHGALDLYLFRISGATVGDVFTISGVETLGSGPGYFNLTCAGLIFSQSIPEPAILALITMGIMTYGRRLRAPPPRSPSAQ